MSLNDLVGPAPLLVVLSTLLSLIMAAVVLGRDSRRFDNRAFFALVLLSLISNINAAVLFFSEIPHPVAHPHFRFLVALGGFTMFALLLFTRSFPTNRPPGRPLLWGGAALALIHFVVMTANAFHPLARAYAALYLSAGGLLVLFFVWQNIRMLPSKSAKTGVLIVQGAILSRMVLTALALSALEKGGDPPFILLVLHLIIAPPLLAALIGYALLRFQLLGVRFFFSRSLAYFLVSTAALLGYVGLLSLARYLLERFFGLGVAPALTTPLLLALLLIAFHPIRVTVEGFLDRRFDREFVRARKAVERYFEQTRNMLDLHDLHRAVHSTTRVLAPGSRLALLMASPSPRLLTLDGFKYFCEAKELPGKVNEVADFPEGGLLLEYFSRSRQSHLRMPIAEGANTAVPEFMKRHNIRLAIPFWREGSIYGILLLQSCNPDQERLRLLLELARHLGLQLQNARLYHQAIEANEALVQSNRELEQTRQFLEQLFETVPVGIVVIDDETRVVKWNKNMERLTGISRDVALNCADLGALLPGLSLDQSDALSPRGLTTPLQRQVQLGSGDKDIIVHLRLGLFRDAQSGLPRTVLILTDITEHVAMQQALENSKRLAALGQFAAAMAHEIRTPMTSIQMNVQILASKVALPPEDSEYFEIILTEIDRLNRTVGEILDFAKPMQLVKAEVHLEELIEEVVRGMYFLLADRGVEVETEVPDGLIVSADAERLKQVLINLLDNASHSIEEKRAGSEAEDDSVDSDRPEGKIVIRGRRASNERKIPGALLEIQDDGQGMAASTLEHIFDPFYTTRATGTGLGLAISRKIAEAHGGELKATSIPSEGSTFSLWLSASY